MMANLVFDCIGVKPDRFAAGPTLLFKMRVAETTGVAIHSIALRCQIRIEPQKRSYTDEEKRRLESVEPNAQSEPRLHGPTRRAVLALAAVIALAGAGLAIGWATADDARPLFSAPR